MHTIRVIGVGECLPGEPIPNAKMEEVFFIRQDWIDQMIGTKTRHFAVDLDEKKVVYSLADLGCEAAKNALESAEVQADAIDFVILSTATPDHLMPATVNLIVDRLGMNHVPAFQVQAGCSGALQGIEVAMRFLQSGYRQGLVIGGDVCNKYFDFRRDFKKMRSSELINFALFGDGAGAVVLTSDSDRPGMTIEKVVNRFEGLGREPGQVMNWFGTIMDSKDRDERGKKIQAAKEDYKAIEKHVPQMSKEMMSELARDLDWNLHEVQHVLPPQLGGHMTDRIVSYLEIDPERAINCVADTGNNGNALPYLQLKRLWERMQPGERAVGVAIESSKWIKTGVALSR